MTDRNALDPAEVIPEDATEDRAAQDHEQADVETGGKPQPGRYPADELPNRDGDATPDAADPTVEWDARVQPERATRAPEQQGQGDPEPEDKPTARDALGKKQKGYAGGQEGQEEAEDSDEDPPLGK